MTQPPEKEVTSSPFEEGPYIQIAAFCDQVIEGKDGAISLIRVIDTLVHIETGLEPPGGMPPVDYSIKLVLALKPGRAKGRHDIRIIAELASGETKTPLARSIYMDGEERGANIIMNISIRFTQEGLHWFNVYFDNVLLTKMPFRVKYQRIVTPQPRQA